MRCKACDVLNFPLYANCHLELFLTLRAVSVGEAIQNITMDLRSR